jgi:hypothetical protein
MLAKMIEWMRGDEPVQDDIPECRMHNVPMELFKKVGKPARFQDQETETYALLFRCPVPGCDETAERRRVRNQIPVPGERTARPAYAIRDRKGL